MFNRIIKSDALIYCALFMTAFLVVFISCLNPFGLKDLDNDTSVFLTIAQGITRGQVPFRDFFDNKGPLLYLISVPGMFLGGFTGVWITELILMCVSALFAYKTALFFGNKNIAFWGVVCSFIVLQTFFYEVAGTEEYALPFMMISLYIFVKYFFTQKEPPVYELILIGICFAVTFFLRTNMFPLWLGFCVVVIVELFQKHKYLPILKYVLSFLTGMFVVFIPVFVYLYLNNAFSDYINQNFIAGSARAFTGFSVMPFIRSFLDIIQKNYCFVPLLVYTAWIIRKNISVYLSFGLLLAYLFTVFFSAVIRTNYDHYNMVLVPFLVPAFTFCVRFVFDYFSNVKYKTMILLLFLCIIFSRSLLSWRDKIKYGIIGNSSRNEVITTGRIIDQNTDTDDKIIFLGYPCRIYLHTKRQSASRYIYQTSGVDYDPNAQKEFILDMQHNKPKIMVIKNQGGRYDHLPEWYAPVYEMIANEYRLLSSENGYFLFIRNSP